MRPSDSACSLVDPGLQPERTSLAWRRTGLSTTVAAVASLRVLPPLLGTWALVLCSLGLVLSAVTWVLARWRGRRVDVALRSAGHLPAGGLLLVEAGLVTVGGALGLVGVLALLAHRP